MFLFALALIPVIGILCLVYFNDKKEKEPIGLLIGLFFAGASTIVSALIFELSGQAILDWFIPDESSILRAMILACIIVAPAEEIGKFLVLRLITWKNRHFDHSYDAIVYAVFVSLGFAAIENIGYVFDRGFGTAIVRMLTAIPGHASFAIFMGYFYSKAKYAKLTKKNGKCALNTLLALLIPIIGHGIYDGIAFSVVGNTDEILVVGIGLFLWIGFVIILFVTASILIVYSARHDFCIVTLPDAVQTVYKPSLAGDWICSCGTKNTLNFCTECGRQRPIEVTWVCPKCGTLATMNFCGICGYKKI